MNSKHTKEEWKLTVTDVEVNGKPIKVAEIGPDRRFRIAILQSSDDATYGYSEEEMLANARLIKAAPKMFEAMLAQHHAIDWLLAQMIKIDPLFSPVSSPVWHAVVKGSAVIQSVTAESTTP